MNIEKMLSVGFFMCVVFLSIGSMVANNEYMNNIANAVAIPIFLLCIFDFLNRIKNNAITKIKQKRNVVVTELKWIDWCCKTIGEPSTLEGEQCFSDYKILSENIVIFDNEIIKIKKYFSLYVPGYILTLFCTFFLSIFANYEIVKNAFVNVNSTVLTLWTLAVFMFDAIFSEILCDKLMMKIEQDLKENNKISSV